MPDHAGSRSLGRDGAPIAERRPSSSSTTSRCHRRSAVPARRSSAACRLTRRSTRSSTLRSTPPPRYRFACCAGSVCTGRRCRTPKRCSRAGTIRGKSRAGGSTSCSILPFALLTLVAAVFRRSRVGATLRDVVEARRLVPSLALGGRVGVDDRGELWQRALSSRDRAVARGVRRARDHDSGDRASLSAGAPSRLRSRRADRPPPRTRRATSTGIVRVPSTIAVQWNENRRPSSASTSPSPRYSSNSTDATRPRSVPLAQMDDLRTIGGAR